MVEFYNQLMVFLNDEDKENAMKLCINALQGKSISVVDLYQNILTPALNSIIDEFPEDEELIWREHVRSGIVRSIIESAYPYVLRTKEELGLYKSESVIVMCPEFEDHELGARMVSDFFTIAGYNSTFIGAKTPENTVLKAVNIIRPKYICISVTNHYNLISTGKIIKKVREHASQDIKVILGGSAFTANPHAYKTVGGDLLLKYYDDIENLHKELE